MANSMQHYLGLVAACVLALTAAAARADYVVQSGDVLELNVAGVVGMRQRLPVNTAGTIRLPLIGAVDIGDKNLSQINEIVRKKLSAKALPQISPNGQQFQIFFDPSQISVDVAEYRPVYVSGDVVRPGEQVFRPGLTARQVIALAGGFQLVRFRTADIFTDSFDWRSELNGHLIELAHENIRLQRIRSELKKATEPPNFSIADRGIAPDAIAKMVRLETNKFKLNLERHANGVEFVRKEISASTARIAVLSEQRIKEKEGLEADIKDHRRLKQLAKKGTTTSARVTAARRDILFSSTRYLQTTSQIALFRRQRAQSRRQLQQLEETRQAALLEELKVSLTAASIANRRIRFLSEKLAYTGGAQSLFRGKDRQVTIKIARKGKKNTTQLIAEEDDPLQPGDVVVVAIKGVQLPLGTTGKALTD